jgi:hypothetical protein
MTFYNCMLMFIHNDGKEKNKRSKNICIDFLCHSAILGTVNKFRLRMHLLRFSSVVFFMLMYRCLYLSSISTAEN